MKRRGFLKLIAGTVAAPLVVKLLPKVAAAEAPLTGFGMAAVKQEGAAIAFDSMSGAGFAKALWPGVEKWYGEQYRNCPAEYKDLFSK